MLCGMCGMCEMCGYVGFRGTNCGLEALRGLRLAPRLADQFDAAYPTAAAPQTVHGVHIYFHMVPGGRPRGTADEQRARALIHTRIHGADKPGVELTARIGIRGGRKHHHVHALSQCRHHSSGMR